MRTMNELISRAVAAQAAMGLGRQMQMRMLVPHCSASSARHIRSLRSHRRTFQTTIPGIPPLQTDSAPSKADLGLQASRESVQESSKEDSAAAKKQEARLKIVMTCTANGCGHRQSHEFTKHSYEKGIVIVQCEKCKNRHLIADHLGWFADAGGKTIEEIMAAKGEEVKRIRPVLSLPPSKT